MHYRSEQSSLQGICRIGRRPERCNGETKDLTDDATKPSRGLPAPAFLASLEDQENLSRRDFGNRPLAERRCEIEQNSGPL